MRNGQKWSLYIDEVIQRWAEHVEVSFGSHHWPTWGNENIIPYWENQRDLYRFIHDQTLRLANNGFTPIEIANMLNLPEELDTLFYNRGYYGSVSHNVRAQYQLYFGWFDGNPANLNKLPPAEAGAKYVEFMGGAGNVLSQCQASFNDGEYRWVAEVMNHLVFAEPENEQARYLLADAYEQLGYQAESGPWRNFYLSGAKELRFGIDTTAAAPNTASPDMVRGMSNELLFNYLAMRFVGTDADAAQMKYKFQFSFDDMEGDDKNVALIVEKGVVIPRVGYQLQSGEITATITMDREDLNDIILTGGNIPDEDISGDKDAFHAFMGQMDVFEFWFHIIEP